MINHLEYRHGNIMVVCPDDTVKLQFAIDFLKFHAKRLAKKQAVGVVELQQPVGAGRMQVKTLPPNHLINEEGNESQESNNSQVQPKGVTLSTCGVDQKQEE